jgi:hypothetical protein
VHGELIDCDIALQQFLWRSVVKRKDRPRAPMTIDISPSPSATTEPASMARPLKIERQGQTWSGSWKVENDQLIVTSGYGSRARPVQATDDPNHVAETVLGTIIHAWRARKA